MKAKIAVVQCAIKQFSPKENLKKAEMFIKKAVHAKAELIVFPEDFVTGPTETKKALADSKNTYRKYFQKLAKKYTIDIVPGSIIEKENSHFYNTTYYIDAQGKIKARYRKINLWHPERNHFTPGNELPVFPTKFGKVGLIICWDLFFPEIFRAMLKKGVQIVICPSYWSYGDAGKGIQHDPLSEIKLVDALCIARAFENEIIFIYCNAAGKFQLKNYKDRLLGHSQITVPFKGVIKKLKHNKEEMFITEIDTSIVKDAEKVYKVKADLRKTRNPQNS